jgi:hypothetical protein
LLYFGTAKIEIIFITPNLDANFLRLINNLKLHRRRIAAVIGGGDRYCVTAAGAVTIVGINLDAATHILRQNPLAIPQSII